MADRPKNGPRKLTVYPHLAYTSTQSHHPMNVILGQTRYKNSLRSPQCIIHLAFEPRNRLIPLQRWRRFSTYDHNTNYRVINGVFFLSIHIYRYIPLLYKIVYSVIYTYYALIYTVNIANN